MSRFTVEFFELKTGKRPVVDFWLSLDKKMRAKTLSMISVLQDEGNALREPFTKHLLGEIFELRICLASRTVRILFFFDYGGKIILTNGFEKKTRKTPLCEIDIAKKYLREYKSRFSNEK